MKCRPTVWTLAYTELLFHLAIDREHFFYGNVSIFMTLILKEFYCIDVPH